MTKELRKRYHDRLTRLSDHAPTDFVLLSSNELKTIASCLEALLKENDELKERIQELDTRIDGLDPAPKYRKTDKEPEYHTSDKEKRYLSYI